MNNYYMTFNKDGIFERGGEGKEESCFKNINNRKIFVITKEQYENCHLLSLVNGKIKFDKTAFDASIKVKADQPLKDRLKAIDIESLRPLRAIQSGHSMAEDVIRLAELEFEAKNLREKLG